MRISPPLNITRSEMEEGLMILEEAITVAEKGKAVAYAA